ncbi:hypothetical protein MKEN_00114800 [Mycena kentingensis (nom. inval.)]|nr:hypothetical protein MKEN_00114800 [Mycena kentingensis (nom. inval.)]
MTRLIFHCDAAMYRVLTRTSTMRPGQATMQKPSTSVGVYFDPEITLLLELVFNMDSNPSKETTSGISSLCCRPVPQIEAWFSRKRFETARIVQASATSDSGSQERNEADTCQVQWFALGQERHPALDLQDHAAADAYGFGGAASSPLAGYSLRYMERDCSDARATYTTDPLVERSVADGVPPATENWKGRRGNQ